jgi:dihydroneopterin aldolase
LAVDEREAETMTVLGNGMVRERDYRVFIRDLVLDCSIGAYPEERLRRQRVRFNVELCARMPAEPLGDNLAKVVSYGDITGGIRRLVDNGHINLVETLAEQIAEMCLADPRVSQVRVSVEKLDVEPAAASVGVEIERRRASHPAIAELFPRMPAAAPEVVRRRGSPGR